MSIKILSILVALVTLSSVVLGVENVGTRRMDEAIKTISNPSVPDRTKHEAMMVLQNLEDPRSIDALFTQINWVSPYGSYRQRSTENSYPAVKALILIGAPSIDGAVKFIRSKQDFNDDELVLTAFLVWEIISNTNGETDPKLPKTSAMQLDWLKANYTLAQMRVIAEKGYNPWVGDYLKTLPPPRPEGADKRPDKSRDQEAPDATSPDSGEEDLTAIAGVEDRVDFEGLSVSTGIWIIAAGCMLGITCYFFFRKK